MIKKCIWWEKTEYLTKPDGFLSFFKNLQTEILFVLVAPPGFFYWWGKSQLGWAQKFSWATSSKLAITNAPFLELREDRWICWNNTNRDTTIIKWRPTGDRTSNFRTRKISASNLICHFWKELSKGCQVLLGSDKQTRWQLSCLWFCALPLHRFMAYCILSHPALE